MGERGLDVLDKYDIEVLSTVKVRGAIKCETDKGSLQLKEYGGALPRLELEDKILTALTDRICVETYIRNTEGELVTESEEGIRYVVKTWHEGKECNVRELREVCLAVRMLAWMHIELARLDDVKVIITDASDNGSDMVTTSFQPCREAMISMFLRHNRELKRVKTYIKARKTKNNMERLIISSFDMFFEQAVQALSLSEESCVDIPKGWTHGEFSHHHVILGPRFNVITDFSHLARGIQIEDLYYFTRKILEKNKWDIKLGNTMLDAYNSVRAMSQKEWDYLYLLFLYPEKYWKQLNFYYNSNKVWIPEKNISKLQAVISQKSVRDKFLESLLSKTTFALKS